MKIIKYPDGSSYAEIETGGNLEFTYKTNSYEDLWHLGQIVDSINNLTDQRPVITIPNLIDAQADRRFSHNQSSGLKLVCDFLRGMRAKFKIFHPHNPEVVESYLRNRVEIIDNSKFIKEVVCKIGQNVYLDTALDSIKSDLVLMSSDAGGFKPLMKLCDQIGWRGETYSASKARSWDSNKEESKFIQQIDRQDFGGKDILIIDDLCIYGGTFKGISTLLKEKNIGKLYLAVSHITIQNHKKDDHVFKYFDHVFTTNSKFDNYYIPNKIGDGGIQPDNLTVFNLF